LLTAQRSAGRPLIFLLSALIAIVGVVAVALPKPAPLRTSLDLEADAAVNERVGADRRPHHRPGPVTQR
jgi:hypothetical protein